jgi:hypothetical protein
VRARVPRAVKRNEIRTERPAFHRRIHCALRRGAARAASRASSPRALPRFLPPNFCSSLQISRHDFLRHSPPFKSRNRREQRDTAISCASASSSPRRPLLRFLRWCFLCAPRFVILNVGAHRIHGVLGFHPSKMSHRGKGGAGGDQAKGGRDRGLAKRGRGGGLAKSCGNGDQAKSYGGSQAKSIAGGQATTHSPAPPQVAPLESPPPPPTAPWCPIVSGGSIGGTYVNQSNQW